MNLPSAIVSSVPTISFAFEGQFKFHNFIYTTNCSELTMPQRYLSEMPKNILIGRLDVTIIFALSAPEFILFNFSTASAGARD